MENFFKILDWLYFVNATFGVGHVVVWGKTYWVNYETDRKKLYDLYKQLN